MTDPSQTTKQMVCFACKEAISSEQFVLVGENNYHLEHFVCQECKNSLAGQLYYEHNENIYCEADYHNLFSPKCEKCKLPIKDKYLNVMGKNFHQDCFVCFKCSSSFENGQYFKQDDNPVCIKCYSSQAKKCAACGEPILSKVYSALDQYWHFECFKCAKCGENFKNESFITLEGKPYHQKCHQVLCVVCEKPVSGEYYQVEGNKALHKDCVTAYKEKKKKESLQQTQQPKAEPPKQEQEPPKQEQEPPKKEEVTEPQKEEEKPEVVPQKNEEAPQEKKEEIPQEKEKPVEVVEKEKTDEAVQEQKEEIPVLKQEVSENIQAKNEEPPKKEEEEVKIEVQAKPLNKPLILDESKPMKTTHFGSTLGIPVQNMEKKRGSVVVNASNYEVFVPEFEEKKVETLQEGFKSLNIENVYPYETLTKQPYPSGVDPAKRETYLGEEDFRKVFAMSKDEFTKLSAWKKNELKKKAKLF